AVRYRSETRVQREGVVARRVAEHRERDRDRPEPRDRAAERLLPTRVAPWHQLDPARDRRAVLAEAPAASRVTPRAVGPDVRSAATTDVHARTTVHDHDASVVPG